MESGGHTPLPQMASGASPAGNGNGVKQTKICVYCGSASGINPAYMEAARQLARVMHEQNIGLVYGGGTVGLMGEVAKTLVSLSGPDAVHGIIPEALVKYERDPTFTSSVAGGDNHGLAVPEERVYGRTTVVKDMHTRKQMMAREIVAAGPGSGFIALSGGFGTIEELFEISTWIQLGILDRGICVLNVDGFYDGILEWIGRSVKEGFIKEANGKILASAATAEDAVRALREYKVSPNVYNLNWGTE